MTCSWRWFIHPETAISKNRNGSSTLCVFKTHYLDRRAAVAKYRIFMQIQFSDHTVAFAAVPLCSAINPFALESMIYYQVPSVVTSRRDLCYVGNPPNP
jgi:hypothetical protein